MELLHLSAAEWLFGPLLAQCLTSARVLLRSFFHPVQFFCLTRYDEPSTGAALSRRIITDNGSENYYIGHYYGYVGEDYWQRWELRAMA